jgi:anti-anti-sigma factor
VIYTMRNEGPTTEIDLKGRLTFADYSIFREITAIFNDAEVDVCFFDLSGLEFIDSAGLGMLLIARDKLQSRNGQLVLRGAMGQVKKMIDLGRLDALFSME